MTVRAGNTPVSWGVHYPDDPRNAPWQLVLDEIAAAGYEQLELGAYGYLPTDAPLLHEELVRRSLTPTAMYVFQPAVSDREVQREVLARADATCRLLAAVGGRFLVVIDERNAVRIPTAGRSADAQRLDQPAFARLAGDISDVARVAAAHGIRPVLHPHVAGYVEFEDEIERMVAALDPELIGVCLDTGHCAYAGIDATALYRRLAERVEHLHFKDVDGDVLAAVLRDQVDFDDAMLRGVFCPIGSGVTDYQAFAQALAEHGYDGTATIEQDHEPSDPDKVEKASRGAVASRLYLERIGLARPVARAAG